MPAGHLPSVAEAEERLAKLRTSGPTSHTFTLQRRFPPPGTAQTPAHERALDDRHCPA